MNKKYSAIAITVVCYMGLNCSVITASATQEEEEYSLEDIKVPSRNQILNDPVDEEVALISKLPPTLSVALKRDA